MMSFGEMCIFSFFQNFKIWPHVWPPKCQLVPIYRPFNIVFLEAIYNTYQKIIWQFLSQSSIPMICEKWKIFEKKLASNDFFKYIFARKANKIFANEDLSFRNEILAFHGRKLKHEGHIFSSYTRNGSVVFMKKIWKI